MLKRQFFFKTDKNKNQQELNIKSPMGGKNLFTRTSNNYSRYL